MRDRYEDSPGEARDVSVRRLGRLTWRATQLGTLATVGFAVVFARNAPAETTTVQNPPTASACRLGHAAARRDPKAGHQLADAETGSRPAVGTRRPAPAAPATTAPATPQLAPPTTPPAPAPTSATPAPTTSSASHGGG